jgi:3-dehydroquinate synthase
MALIKSNGYSVQIGTDIYPTISSFLAKQKYSQHIMVCDSNTLNQCLSKLILNCKRLADAEIIELEPGEENKSLEFSAHIWQTLIENKADKQSLIINFGGGVVSDIGGFCASTYKRGIDFINIPTSLLAMADASVGGKTGIDFNEIKNSIGTFAQPKAVFINPDFLKTLPKRHFKNGLAEIFKMALIYDKKFWAELKTIEPEDNAELLITKSVGLKNKLVLEDPFDNGVRKTLNFGHSIGHAMEALLLPTTNALLHGEAIVIGMMIESHLALQKKLVVKKEFDEVYSVLTNLFTPPQISQLSLSSILEVLKNDKKNSNNKFRFALINKIGSCAFDVEVTELQIKKAIEYYHSHS